MYQNVKSLLTNVLNFLLTFLDLFFIIPKSLTTC